MLVGPPSLELVVVAAVWLLLWVLLEGVDGVDPSLLGVVDPLALCEPVEVVVDGGEVPLPAVDWLLSDDVEELFVEEDDAGSLPAVAAG